MDSTLFALLALAVCMTAYFLGICLSNQFTRRRWARKIKCLCGRHAPDSVKAEVGGRNVQRCLYCDTLLREYTVTKDGAKKNPTVRRTY